DVERSDVIAQAASTSQERDAAREVESLHHTLLEFDVAALCEAGDIDFSFGAPVVTREDAREHPGVRLLRERTHERDARAVERLLRQAAQHHQVAVAGPDEENPLHAFS